MTMAETDREQLRWATDRAQELADLERRDYSIFAGSAGLSFSPRRPGDELLPHHLLRVRSRTAETAGPPASCRLCGCTERDCRGCVERTGAPCSWVEEPGADRLGLCSACAAPANGGGRP